MEGKLKILGTNKKSEETVHISLTFCVYFGTFIVMSACLFVDIPDFLITKLQCVQNAVARIVLNLKKYDSVTPYLMNLHWLPVRECIIYKLNLIVFKVLKGDAPNYSQSLLSINQLARPLRSGDKMYKLKEPRWKLKSK